MANQLIHLLREWYPQRDQTEWVLGTIYKTEGSCYRKAGAMMLFNGFGQQYGLLSGGCLESGIQQQAKRVILTGQAMTLCYDATDEDDLAFQLGIGCGGIVHILLQPLDKQNNYLELLPLYESLKRRQGGYYRQLIDDKGTVKSHFIAESGAHPGVTIADACNSRLEYKQKDNKQTQWLISRIQLVPHLLVIGGGIDACPVINIASELGWETSLWDPRPSNVSHGVFKSANHIINCDSDELAGYAVKHRVDSVILMSHNVKLDAAALKSLQTTSIHYMALLGPESRRKKVLEAAKLSEPALKIPLSGPAGLDIGGELPESIALAIIAECHASLMQTQALPIDSAIAV